MNDLGHAIRSLELPGTTQVGMFIDGLYLAWVDDAAWFG